MWGAISLYLCLAFASNICHKLWSSWNWIYFVRKMLWTRTATKIPFMYFFSGNCRPQSQFSHSCVCERFISPRIGSHISCSGIGRSLVGIYKALTDTWMCKLGLWPRNSFSVNICFIGSLQYVSWSRLFVDSGFQVFDDLNQIYSKKNAFSKIAIPYIVVIPPQSRISSLPALQIVIVLTFHVLVYVRNSSEPL
jgi:hypothetical protein